MTVHAKLVPTRVPDAPEAAVLVLHGGASRRGDVRVSPTQLSVLRMIPIAARIAHAGGNRLAVFRLLNSTRGWDTAHTPVDDVGWALDQLRERFGTSLPTCLVGHSLGGRAALLAGSRPEVRSVVALNPWVYATDGRVSLRDKQVLIVHGTEDRIAKSENSAVVARALARSAEVGYISVDGGKHAMLGRLGVFDRLAADFALSTLLGEAVSGPVAEVRGGRQWVTV
ncbi:alpha/beta hydrolase [Nocardioides mesophilus]|uniref:Alpha/beta hydrolase n=1 Tax=Nocardioides mesophilus TaxID=433659 RepID=A0A7G9RFI5_9ACTN|nr:alpha/beta hydrolase [Nocardioides mesophilus]QNN54360.1 alpha/beta hydrolase [Nocardioides mesophilus]